MNQIYRNFFILLTLFSSFSEFVLAGEGEGFQASDYIHVLYGSFLLIVILIILFHCYLKNQQRNAIEDKIMATNFNEMGGATARRDNIIETKINLGKEKLSIKLSNSYDPSVFPKRLPSKYR